MSVLVSPRNTATAHHQPPLRRYRLQSHEYQHQQHQQEAMTPLYPDHYSSLSYGLITPPSEMRSTPDFIANGETMDSNNILVPPSTSRYYLRKQSSSQTTLYPGVVNNNYQNNQNYNSYADVRRRSMSSSTATSRSEE